MEAEATVEAVLEMTIGVEEKIAGHVQQIITAALKGDTMDAEAAALRGFANDIADLRMDLYHSVNDSLEIENCPPTVLELAKASLAVLEGIYYVECNWAGWIKLMDANTWNTGENLTVFYQIQNMVYRYRIALRLAGVQKAFPPIDWSH
jgi:hypothetical protein